MDKFDFEQALINCWNITDDLDALSNMIDEDELNADRVKAVLRGLKELYSYKFEVLFDQFEQLL